jgi:hypothetical protein
MITSFDYAPAVMFHNLRRYLIAAELGFRIKAVSNLALKSWGIISMQYFSHCMGTCDEEEKDVQSKMISNGRASATDDVKVWV